MANLGTQLATTRHTPARELHVSRDWPAAGLPLWSLRVLLPSCHDMVCTSGPARSLGSCTYPACGCVTEMGTDICAASWHLTLLSRLLASRSTRLQSAE
jgi:hypothetical protein